jgi:CBS-domain-containing membrane protein
MINARSETATTNQHSENRSIDAVALFLPMAFMNGSVRGLGSSLSVSRCGAVRCLHSPGCGIAAEARMDTSLKLARF